jgi:cytidyltransferase-like protein
MGLEHLPHLYDDRELTFNEIQEILTKAAKGEIKGTEKVDGLNLYLGYKDGQPKAARNNYDIKNGGLSADELAQREFNGEQVSQIFDLAFQSFANLVSKLDRKLLDIIFGPTGNIFLNSEILNGKTNVINYGSKTILIHRNGHKKFNEQTGEVENIREDTSKAIAHIINQMNDNMNKEMEGTEFRVQQDPITQLPVLQDQSVLADTIQRLKTAGFEGDMNIHQYLFTKIKTIVKEKLPTLNEKNTNDIVNKMIGVKGTPSITVLKKYVDENPNFTQELKALISNKKQIINDVMFPIEDAIHDFSVEILKKLNSSFIENTEEEAERIKQELKDEVIKLKNYDGPYKDYVIDNLKRQLKKIKHIDNVQTSLEGFVFNFGNKYYKFTGNFAPINQIMGLYKYKLNENVQQVQKNGLFPGSFRPPHKGHLDLIKQALNDFGKITVIISQPEKHARSSMSADESKKLFDIYTKGMPVETIIGQESSPYVEAANYMKQGRGDCVLTSNKEETKFDYFDFPKKVYEARMPVSAREMRAIIESPKTREEKKAELLGYLPQLQQTDLMSVFDILLKDDNTQLLNGSINTINLNEIFDMINDISLNEGKIKNIDLNIKEIFNIIDEVAVGSSMAAGAVEGSTSVSHFKQKKKKKRIYNINEILTLTEKYLKEDKND